MTIHGWSCEQSLYILAAMSCPICLESLANGAAVFTRWCGHKEHLACLYKHAGARCTICRTSWQDDDETRFDRLVEQAIDEGNGADLAPWGSPGQSRGSLGDSTAVRDPPLDVVPHCCPHVGPAPQFEPEIERAMLFMPVGETDEWACMSCGATVQRAHLDLGQFVIGYSENFSR